MPTEKDFRYLDIPEEVYLYNGSDDYYQEEQ